MICPDKRHTADITPQILAKEAESCKAKGERSGGTFQGQSGVSMALQACTNRGMRHCTTQDQKPKWRSLIVLIWLWLLEVELQAAPLYVLPREPSQACPPEDPKGVWRYAPGKRNSSGSALYAS